MTISSLTDSYTLNNGVKIPGIGFGTWQSADGDEAYQAVLDALKSGYRHIDTAAIYGNESSVGRAIADSKIDRQDLFVTSKLWNNVRGYDETLAALDESLNKLGLEYLDLYLIHWPNPIDYRANWAEMNAETWRAMEAAYRSGKVRAIGISNFQVQHLEALLKTAEIKPMVNQLFINPSDLENSIVELNQQHEILTEAYSPLGTGRLLATPAILNLADRLGKSPAQIAIRWSLQHGFLPLPKSTHKKYIEQNTQVFDFELSDADMRTLDTLNGTIGTHIDPDTTDF